MRLKLLHLNAMKNVPVKYEFIKEANLLEKVIHKKKEVKLRDVLLEVREGNEKLFVATEQESGKHSRSVFVLIKPTTRKEA